MDKLFNIHNYNNNIIYNNVVVVPFQGGAWWKFRHTREVV